MGERERERGKEREMHLRFLRFILSNVSHNFVGQKINNFRTSY
jgi:hypothetical protein